MRIKFLLSLFIIFIIGSGVIFYCYSISASNSTGSLNYKDGVYEGSSRSIYTFENFWGKVRLTINNGKITNVEYQVIDQDRNEVFSETYERHYSSNFIYIEQCRNEWKGIQSYPQLLLNMQNVYDLDAITGATWSFNLFKDSVAIALKDAYL